MSGVEFPPCPPSLKPIQHYLSLANDHDKRDPVVSYWSRLYGLQAALKLDKASPEARKLLTALMDWLEVYKREHKEDEAISNEVVAQAHLENYALKLFLFADREDRSAHFNKNVVKAFYKAGVLYDIMLVFGELTEEVAHHRKYAKWKAAYIHNCLKNGEQPIPGPMQDDDEVMLNVPSQPELGGSDYQAPAPPVTPAEQQLGFPGVQPATAPINQPTVAPINQPPEAPVSQPTGSVQLTAEDMTKAQKYCKWATSALNYEDVPAAMVNLQKALHLLQTGQDS